MKTKASLWAVALLVFGAALFFVLSAKPAAAATTWYVDANVPASGAGTEASPFKKVIQAVNAASGGDTIYLKNGTYAPSTNGEAFPISTGKALTFEGQSQDGVILNAEVANPETVSYMFMMNSDSGFTKMTFTGYYAALYLTGENTSVTYCTFQGYYNGAMRASQAIYSLASGTYSHNILHDHRGYALMVYGGLYGTRPNFSATIENNEIKNDHTSPYSKAPIGIYMVGTATEANQATITDNIISGTDGQQLLYVGIFLVENTVDHPQTNTNFVTERNTISGHFAGLMNLATIGRCNFQISNNYIMATDSAYRNDDNSIGIFVAEADDPDTSASIYNNLITTNGYGIYLSIDDEGSTRYDEISVTNNTLHDIGANAIAAYTNTYGPGNQTVVNTRNNIIAQAKNGLYNGGDDGYVKTFTSENNAFYDITEASYTQVMPSENDRQNDPEFADKEHGDYSLNPSSLLIDAGTETTAPPDDIEGTPRPQGRGIDIGAYESTDWSGMFRIGNGYIATAPASQGGPQYKFFKYDGAQPYRPINAFNTDWRSEFKVQTADINGDGVDEIVALRRRGRGTKIARLQEKR